MFESTEIARINTPQQPASELSALEHLQQSFTSEAKKQVNGVAQIFGGGADQVAEPAEADTQTGRNAQLLGKAAADVIPMVMTAAALRVGLGRYVARTGELANPLFKSSPLGVSLVESAATGFLTSSLLTPSDASAQETLSDLLIDRTKHGITGATSFTLLTGANILAKSTGEALTSGLARKIMTNPVGNGVLSGFPSGLVNAEMESVMSDGHLTTDSTKINQSIADMTLLGGVFSIGGVLFTRRSSSATTAVSDATRQSESSKPAVLADGTAPSVSSKLAALADGTAQSEPSKLALPPDGPALSERLSIATEGTARSESSMPADFRGETAARELSPSDYRRYMAKRNRDSELEAKSEDEQWTVRSDRLSEAIAYRINRMQPKEFDFWNVADSYRPADQPIVKGLLAASAGNATDYALQKSLFSIHDAGQSKSHTFAVDPAAAGNMLGYLFRKTNRSGGLINYLHEQERLWSDSLLFAEVDSFTPAQLDKIKASADHASVSIVDMNFDRLPNVVDFALGETAVKLKLDTALAATKQTMQQSPELTIEQAIGKTLTGASDQIVAQLSAGTKNPITIIRPQAMSVEEAFRPRVKPDEVKEFLEKTFKKSSQRIMAAEMLAEDVDFYTTHTMISRLQTLQLALDASAKAKGLNPANDKFIVGLEGGEGSSEAYMAYLHARANATPADKLETLAEFSRKKADTDRPVIVEDAYYTGNQISYLIGNVRASTKVIAAIAAHDKFARSMFASQDSKKAELVTIQTDFSSTDRHLDSEDAAVLSGVMEQPGYGNIASLKVFPHMTSDNTPRWLASFGYKLLKTPSPYYLPSPWDPSTPSAKPQSNDAGMPLTPSAKPKLHELDFGGSMYSHGSMWKSMMHFDMHDMLGIWDHSPGLSFYDWDSPWGKSQKPNWKSSQKLKNDAAMAEMAKKLAEADVVNVKELPTSTSKQTLAKFDPKNPTPETPIKLFLPMDTKPIALDQSNGSAPKFLSEKDKKKMPWLKAKDAADETVDDLLAALNAKKVSVKTPSTYLDEGLLWSAMSSKKSTAVSDLFALSKHPPVKIHPLLEALKPSKSSPFENFQNKFFGGAEVEDKLPIAAVKKAMVQPGGFLQ